MRSYFARHVTGIATSGRPRNSHRDHQCVARTGYSTLVEGGAIHGENLLAGVLEIHFPFGGQVFLITFLND